MGDKMLEDKIDSMLFERTAISKKPDELIKTELSKLKNEQINQNVVQRIVY